MWRSCKINKLLKFYKIMNILKKFWHSIATRFIPQMLATSVKKTERWKGSINELQNEIIMATLEELGKKYGVFLKDTILIKYQSIVDIEKKIDNLTYSENGKKLTKEDKLKIIESILIELGLNIPLNESESIDSLISLVNELKNKIKNG